MAQRQFRSDDTDKWLEGFGKGADGPATLAGTYGAGVGGYIGACSGTAGQKTLTTPAGWGLPVSGYWFCLIHQTQGTGAGNWELNKITAINGTTSTLQYSLVNTYGTGAQCILMLQYNGITISGTLTAPAWNGSTGGIIALLDKGTTTIGTLTASAAGFRGGVAQNGIGQSAAQRQGEGYPGIGGNTTVQNGNGGGGGIVEGPAQLWASSGGGGNAAAGGNGVPHNGAGTPQGGAAVGNAGLTSFFLGGGSGAISQSDSNKQNGVAGGGGVIIISNNIVVNTSINTYGANAVRIQYDGYATGSGAGGSILLKCKTATLGSGIITALPGTPDSVAISPGGTGSVGRIHLDYKTSYSGTTNPAIDARQDLTLDYPLAGGAFLYNFL